MAAEEEKIDAWSALSERYRHDEEAQFLLIVEQLGEARTKILSVSPSQQRMGLVLLDNVAEILLHRHKERLIRFAREARDFNIPRLDERDLKKLNRDFGARARLASEPIRDPMLKSSLRSLLDTDGVAIFRASHAYRGRVYHGDHHNPAAMPLIARAYLGAVCRAFVRQQIANVATSNSAIAAKLAPYGYKGLRTRWGEGFFSFYEAAEEVIAHLTDGLDVGTSEAAEVLGADLELRCSWAQAMIDSVVGDGYPADRIEWSFAWGEFWEKHGADEQIVACDREKAALWADRLRNGGGADSFERECAVLEARNRRVQELWSDFKASLGPGDVARVRKLGKRLTRAQSLGSLFDRYRRLDEHMTRIELQLEELAIGWDRHIQEEIDASRGK